MSNTRIQDKKMPQKTPQSYEQFIEDPSLAWDMAHAEKPYRDLSQRAQDLGLGEIATDIIVEANTASDLVGEASKRETFNPLKVGLETRESEINIHFTSFEQAQKQHRRLSDTLVDAALEKRSSMKGYLDTVPLSHEEEQIIDNPERIAEIHQTTAKVILHNLGFKFAPTGDTEIDQQRIDLIKGAKKEFSENMQDIVINKGSKAIREYCESNERLTGENNIAINYPTLYIEETDVFEMSDAALPYIRPNLRAQRQPSDNFIVAYSDERVIEKLARTAEHPTKRIYLNPTLESAPIIFEQILHASNAAKIPIQIKMLDRTRELIRAHKDKQKGKKADGLRGDGIILYTDDEHANDALELVLGVAQDNQDAFKGRITSRLPQPVAEGVSVGDESPQAVQQGHSLTSHRAQILEDAVRVTRESGKQGDEARAFFRKAVKRSASVNGVNPDNLAFDDS